MSELVIHVRNSGIVPRMRTEEDARGSLLAVEEGGVPFVMRRAYTISDVAQTDIRRGEHAHKKTDQVIFIVKGGLTLHLDDGTVQQELRLSENSLGIRLGPLLWHSMSDFTPDCVVLVVASDHYDESDYIRDYDDFRTYISEQV